MDLIMLAVTDFLLLVICIVVLPASLVYMFRRWRATWSPYHYVTAGRAAQQSLRIFSNYKLNAQTDLFFSFVYLVTSVVLLVNSLWIFSLILFMLALGEVLSVFLMLGAKEEKVKRWGELADPMYEMGLDEEEILSLLEAAG